MRHNSVMRSGIVTLLVAGLAACDNAALTSPTAQASPTSAASTDRGTTSTPTAARPTTGRPNPARPAPTPTRPVAKRPVCRPDTGLTQEQIEKIRALQQAFNEAVADDLRLIARIEAEARAAAEAGAPRERVEAILAQADRAKAHVAEMEQRLRQAISDVLTDDQRHCVAVARKL